MAKKKATLSQALAGSQTSGASGVNTRAAQAQSIPTKPAVTQPGVQGEHAVTNPSAKENEAEFTSPIVQTQPQATTPEQQPEPNMGEGKQTQEMIPTKPVDSSTGASDGQTTAPPPPKMAQSIPTKPVSGKPSDGQPSSHGEVSMAHALDAASIPTKPVVTQGDKGSPEANKIPTSVHNQAAPQSGGVPSKPVVTQGNKGSPEANKVPISTHNMGLGGSPESIPEGGMPAHYDYPNAKSVIVANSLSEGDSAHQISANMTAFHEKAQSKKAGEWQSARDHSERRASAWDAGHTAGGSDVTLGFAKLAYQKVDMGCLAEFEEGFKARVAAKMKEAAWEPQEISGQKMWIKGNLQVLAEANGTHHWQVLTANSDALVDEGVEGSLEDAQKAAMKTASSKTAQERDSRYMNGHGHIGRSGDKWCIFDHYEAMPIEIIDQAKAEAMWQAQDGSSGDVPYALVDGKAEMLPWRQGSKQAQTGPGNDSPGTRNPDMRDVRPVSGEPISGTGGVDSHGIAAAADPVEQLQAKKLAQAGASLPDSFRIIGHKHGWKFAHAGYSKRTGSSLCTVVPTSKMAFAYFVLRDNQRIARGIVPISSHPKLAALHAFAFCDVLRGNSKTADMTEFLDQQYTKTSAEEKEAQEKLVGQAVGGAESGWNVDDDGEFFKYAAEDVVSVVKHAGGDKFKWKVYHNDDKVGKGKETSLTAAQAAADKFYASYKPTAVKTAWGDKGMPVTNLHDEKLVDMGKGEHKPLEPGDYGKYMASLKVAVDDKAKEYYDSYFGGYGKQLTKDMALQAPAKTAIQKTASVISHDLASKVASEFDSTIAELLEKGASGAAEQLEISKKALLEACKLAGEHGDTVITDKYGKTAQAAEQWQAIDHLDGSPMTVSVEESGGKWTAKATNAKGVVEYSVSDFPSKEEASEFIGELFKKVGKVAATDYKGHKIEVENGPSGWFFKIDGEKSVAQDFGEAMDAEAEAKAAVDAGNFKGGKVAFNEFQTPPSGGAVFGDSVTAPNKPWAPDTQHTTMWIDDAAQHGDRNEVSVLWDKKLNECCSELQMRGHLKTFIQQVGQLMDKNWGLVADIQVLLCEMDECHAVVGFKAAFPSPFVQTTRIIEGATAPSGVSHDYLTHRVGEGARH